MVTNCRRLYAPRSLLAATDAINGGKLAPRIAVVLGTHSLDGFGRNPVHHCRNHSDSEPRAGYPRTYPLVAAKNVLLHAWDVWMKTALRPHDRLAPVMAVCY